MEIGLFIINTISLYVWFSLSVKLFVSLDKDLKSIDIINGFRNRIFFIIKVGIKAFVVGFIAMFFAFIMLYISGYSIEYVGIENILSSNVSIYSEVL